MCEGVIACAALERLGERSVDNLLAGIEASKQQPLWRLLTALNIRHVGTSNAQVLADRFGTLDAISEQSEETLSEVDEIGPVIARAVFEFFHSDFGRTLIEDLRGVGLDFGTPILENENGQAEGPLAGKTVVVTGTLERFTRDEIKELLRRHEAKASGSVSRNTDFLIAGEKAGGKLEKAEALGVPVLSEADLVELLDQGK